MSEPKSDDLNAGHDSAPKCRRKRSFERNPPLTNNGRDEIKRWLRENAQRTRVAMSEPKSDDLNALVTNAIFEAERALDEAIEAWRQVQRWEDALSKDHQQAPDFEKLIAQRGVATASITVDVLKALRGKK